MTYLVNKGLVGELGGYPREIEIVAEFQDVDFGSVVDYDLRDVDTNRLWWVLSTGKVQWYDVSNVESPSLENSYDPSVTNQTPTRSIVRHTDGTNNDHILLSMSDKVIGINVSNINSPFVDYETALENWLNDGIIYAYNDIGGRYFGVSATGADRYTLIDVTDVTANPGIILHDSIFSPSELNQVSKQAQLFGDDFLHVVTADGLTGIRISTGVLSIMESKNDSSTDGGDIARMTSDQLFNLYVRGTDGNINAIGWQNIWSGSPYTLVGGIAVPSDTVFEYLGQNLLICHSRSNRSIFTINVSDPANMYIEDLIRDSRLEYAAVIIPIDDSNYAYILTTTFSPFRLLVVKAKP